MSSTPIVTVVIPCFNQGRFLAQAIDSVRKQSLAEWECIIVNDGSTDCTHDVAEAFVKRDVRVRLVEQENRGLSGARNTGLAHAHGRFVQFLDADDLLLPTKLKTQLAIMVDCHEPSVSYSDYYCADISSPTIERTELHMSCELAIENMAEDLAARWEINLCIPIHCFLFDRRFFETYKIYFDTTLPNHEDWDCWLQIFSLRPKVVFIPEKLACYRRHPTSMCRDRPRMRQGFESVIRKHLRLNRGNRHMRRILKRRLQATRGIRPLIKRAKSYAKRCLQAVANRLRWPLVPC